MMQKCSSEAALFILTEACSCRIEQAYFAVKISRNGLVCKNAVALPYYGSLQAPSDGLLSQLLANILYIGLRATINFQNVKVALNSMYRIFDNFAKRCVLLCLLI